MWLVMRILHFAHSFFPVYGGTTTRPYNLLSDGINEHYLYAPQAPSIYVPEDIGILRDEDIFENISGSPLKLWEYMACGKPVIATNAQDFRFLEEYNAGIVVESEKTEEVADAIITLLKNKDLREEMGKNERKYVVENRSWGAVAGEVEKVMKEAIKQ